MRRILLPIFVILLFAAAVRAAEPACFPFETLPAELRAKADEMLLKALDSEALYTIVGGMKPMSSSFASFKFSVEKPDLKEIEDARRILAAWHCGEDIYADIHHFARIYEGVRHAEGVVFHRAALASAMTAHRDFFAPYGLTPNAHPMEILMAIEYSAQGPRWRGQGYLFGYPDNAVDFFVTAGEEQEKTGKIVPRDFISIPTFASATNRFVWAVPKGYEQQESDRQLRARAEEIFNQYKERRAKYIGPGKPGVVRLLRDWLNERKGLKRAA